MTFTQILADVCNKANIDVNDTTLYANVKTWVNQSYKDFNNRYKWTWKERTGTFQTVKNYTTGTVTVTANSRAVTGSGTTFTSAMVGYYFNVAGDTDWYKIIGYTSGTVITLETPYARTTASSRSYTIHKKFYQLNTDVDELINVYNDSTGTRLAMDSVNEGQVLYDGSINGDPQKYQKWGLDRIPYTNTTGTWTAALKVVTGTGTSWLDNIRPGDRFIVSSADYNVYQVDSDTSLRLYQNIGSTASGSCSFARVDVEQIELDKVPNDYNINIRYTYFAKTYDMLTVATDTPEVPEKYVPLIISKAISMAFEYMDDPRATNKLQEYEALLQSVIKKEANKQAQVRTWTHAGDSPSSRWL